MPTSQANQNNSFYCVFLWKPQCMHKRWKKTKTVHSKFNVIIEPQFSIFRLFIVRSLSIGQWETVNLAQINSSEYSLSGLKWKQKKEEEEDKCQAMTSRLVSTNKTVVQLKSLFTPHLMDNFQLNSNEFWLFFRSFEEVQIINFKISND